MRGLQLYVIAIGAWSLWGCSAFGVPATDDPNRKLSYASGLIDDNRPIPAQRLISEALEAFKINGDRMGTAEAYRLYGFLYRSRDIDKFEKNFRDGGFLDKTVPLDNRYTKSIENFEKAKDIYTQNNKFDKLTNVYLNMGVTYEVMKNKSAACEAFDKSLESNREFLKTDPNVKLDLPTGYTSYEEFIKQRREKVGCS